MKLFIILATSFAVAYGVLPPKIFKPKCPRKGSKTHSCVMKGIERFRPYLKKGLPDINIPRMEPFKLRWMDLDAEVESLTIKGEATNIVAYGASNYKVKSLKFCVGPVMYRSRDIGGTRVGAARFEQELHNRSTFIQRLLDMDNHFMELVVFVPKLSVTADYDSTGSKFADKETSGSGQFKASLNDITATITTKGHNVIKKKLEYSKIDDVNINIQFGNSNIQIDPDEKTIVSKTIAQFFQANPDMILESLSPVINTAAAPIIQRYLTKILNVVPLSDIFYD